MKIAHLSDIHLDSYARSIRMARFVCDLLENEVDHVVIAGDVVENVDHYCLHEFISHLKLNLGNYTDYSDLITIIPGNHDIFPGNLKDLKGGISFLGFKSENKNYQSFKRLTKIFNSSYPGIKIINNIEIVQIDTTAYFRLSHAEGNLDEEDKDWILENISGSNTVKLLVMHHWPFRIDNYLGIDYGPNEMNFDEASGRRIKELIKKGNFDLVLCGHRHKKSRRKLGNALVYRPKSSDYEEDGADIFYYIHTINSKRKITSDWYKRHGSEYATGEYLQIFKSAGNWENCENCDYLVKEYWYFCPECGEELTWGDSRQITDCECGYCECVVADEFSYCPWCGEDIEDDNSSEYARKRVTGFKLDFQCDNEDCEGNVMYPMDYCPWCGDKQDWDDREDFDDECPHCGRGMDCVMYYCPWCGEEAE